MPNEGDGEGDDMVVEEKADKTRKDKRIKGWGSYVNANEVFDEGDQVCGDVSEPNACVIKRLLVPCATRLADPCLFSTLRNTSS